MKQILYILLILLLSVGCAQKPAAPKGNNNYPVSSPSSRPGSFSNNGRPPLPHQQKELLRQIKLQMSVILQW